MLDQSRSTFPEKIEFGPEVECFPYGAWNNSFRHVGARMALAQTMGATNPAEAKEGTIRAQFGENIERNAVHGSDSPESASFEISYFFNELDLVR